MTPVDELRKLAETAIEADAAYSKTLTSVSLEMEMRKAKYAFQDALAEITPKQFLALLSTLTAREGADAHAATCQAVAEEWQRRAEAAEARCKMLEEAIAAECHRLHDDWTDADVTTARLNLLAALSPAPGDVKP